MELEEELFDVININAKCIYDCYSQISDFLKMSHHLYVRLISKDSSKHFHFLVFRFDLFGSNKFCLR